MEKTTRPDYKDHIEAYVKEVLGIDNLPAVGHLVLSHPNIEKNAPLRDLARALARKFNAPYTIAYTPESDKKIPIYNWRTIERIANLLTRLDSTQLEILKKEIFRTQAPKH